MVVVNQVRDQIGGSRGVAALPKSLGYRATVSIELDSVSFLGDGATVTGERVLCKIHRNITGIPNQKVEIDLYYNTGFCYYSSLFDIALRKKILKKRGTWFFFENETIGQGKGNAIKFLSKNPLYCKKFLTILNSS